MQPTWFVKDDPKTALFYLCNMPLKAALAFRLTFSIAILLLGCAVALPGVATPDLAQTSTPPGNANLKTGAEPTGPKSQDEQEEASTPDPEPNPIPLTPAQMPPVPPQVSYKNGELTIIAENCSLGDILIAVRRLTGVEIDVPPSASSERMAAKVGPGSTRDVLTTLLGSTNFDFIMQAADDDPNEIQSLLLMPRTRNASHTESAKGSSPWSVHRANQRSQQSAESDETTGETDNGSSPAPVASDGAATPSPAVTPAASPVSADATTPERTTPIEPTPAETTDRALATAASTPAPASDASSLSPSDQMMQGLRRLYEQRKQMQEQQNSKSTPTDQQQGPAAPSPQ